MGLVNYSTVGNLLNMVRSGLNAKAMATHHFSFDQFEEAYDVFGHATEHNAVRLLSSRGRPHASIGTHTVKVPELLC